MEDKIGEFHVLYIFVGAVFITLCVFAIIKDLQQNNYDWFSPMVVVSGWQLLYFGVAPILRVLIYPPSQDIVRQWVFVQIWIIIGWACLWVGYTWSYGAELATKLPKFDGEWDRVEVLTIVLILTGISIAGGVMFFDSVGGIENYVDNFGNRILLWNKNKGIFSLMRDAGQIGVMIWFAFIINPNSRKKYFPESFKWGVLVFLVGLTILQRIPLGGRSGILWVVISLLLIYHRIRSRIRIFQVLSTLLIGLVFIYITGEIRTLVGQSGGVNNLERLELGQDEFWEESITRTYGGFIDIVVRIFEGVPSEVNYQYGLSYLLPFVYLIPRQIFEDKPLYPALLLTDVLYAGNWEGTSYLTPSMWGETFMNLGYVGMMIIPVFYGVIMRAFLEYTKQETVTPAQAIIAFLAFQWTNGIVIGDFVNVNTPLLSQLLTLLVILAFLSKRR